MRYPPGGTIDGELVEICDIENGAIEADSAAPASDQIIGARERFVCSLNGTFDCACRAFQPSPRRSIVTGPISSACANGDYAPESGWK